MPKTVKNHGKAWTAKEIETLKQLVGAGVPRDEIAKKLGRKVAAIHQKTYQLKQENVSDTLTSQDVTTHVVEENKNKNNNHKPWWKRLLGI